MAMIASKLLAGGLAAATALGSAVGGYVAKDDISDASQVASKYIEMRLDRHYQDLSEEELNKALGLRFSSQGGNP
ncbi:hypothetical protein [Vibrio sp. THAF190c]|uniref:hypothetical protein n=1 Tax=Vibrio sp. THAF190c TaxID=2587865 RepID=UPI00126892C1|nr:hypothetical protein [Vibrio sp. THAF190c]QFT13550.1 hypothetical protein FIV04_26705 [Vibrio sp. THAF190c]